MSKNNEQRTHPSEWKYPSQDREGFHEVVTPGNSPCTAVWAFRLNLSEGNTYNLVKDYLELNGAVVKGQVVVIHNDKEIKLHKFDSFYLPGREQLEIKALSDSVMFIGGGLYEGKGRFFTRKYDLNLPLGDIHQVHGQPPYKREVFMTIAQQDEGSRLICGITYGEEGKWTSWPPHQHSKDLEEIYCYFDIPAPKKAFHFASRKEGEFEFIHDVSTGDFVIIPE